MKIKKTKKVIIAIIMVVIFILGILVGNLIEKNKENEIVNEEETTRIVEVEVGTQTIENTLTSSVKIKSSGTENLELDTTKYFQTMCVEENDIVKTGENILEYTDGTYLVATYDCLINSMSVPETENKCTSSNYIEVENLSNMTMNLSISETEINKIEKGQEVEIELSAIEDTTYTGTITSINNVGTYSSSGTTFSAVVTFENDGNAKPGMSASCEISLEKAEECIAVPTEAVQTKDNEKYVVVVDENGNTENVTIETGISNDSYVQVLSGLTGGETIQMTEVVSSTNNMDMTNIERGGARSQEEMPPGDMDMPRDMGEEAPRE